MLSKIFQFKKATKGIHNIILKRYFAVQKIKSVSEFETLVNSSAKLIVIDYKADWCNPCRRISPIFEDLSNTNDDVIFASVDCDEVSELAAQRGVTSLPTFEFIKNGKAIEQVVGSNPTALEQAINNNK